MKTKNQLITLIQELQSKAEKVLTRDTFRKETELFDSEWKRYFGSWIEFKAAAGLEETKTQRALSAAVTKHSSVDNLKNSVQVKNQWEGAFLKPQGDRFQTILAGSDVHGSLCDPFWRRVFVDTAKRVQPAKIVLVGDVFDFPNFSKYTQDPRTYNVTEEFHWNDKFFGDLREACPDAEITLLEGNHSARLVKYLMESAPSIMPILSEIHGMDVAQLLGLTKHQINYVAKADLAVFNENEFKKEIAKNYYIAYDTVLFHHFPACKTWGMNAQSGHHHHIQVNSYFNVQKGPVNWVQAGCGHVRNAGYAMGERWQNGFALWHVDTEKKLAQPEIIDCTHSMVVVGGKWYTRTEEETLII